MGGYGMFLMRVLHRLSRTSDANGLKTLMA